MQTMQNHPSYGRSFDRASSLRALIDLKNDLGISGVSIYRLCDGGFRIDDNGDVSDVSTFESAVEVLRCMAQ